MLRKKFLAFLAAVALACGAVGCKADTDMGRVETNAETLNVSADVTEVNINAEPKKESQTKIAEADMETIEPPEDGWTLEDLLSVTYIYGQKISYPCTLKDLGENFEFDSKNYYKDVETNTITLTLNYKENPTACVIMDEFDEKKIDKNTEILRFFFSQSLECEITVNGIGLNNTKDQVMLNLGVPDEIVKNTFYYGTAEYVLALSFDSKDNVIGIHIFLQDYSL